VTRLRSSESSFVCADTNLRRHFFVPNIFTGGRNSHVSAQTRCSNLPTEVQTRRASTISLTLQRDRIFPRTYISSSVSVRMLSSRPRIFFVYILSTCGPLHVFVNDLVLAYVLQATCGPTTCLLLLLSSTQEVHNCIYAFLFSKNLHLLLPCRFPLVLFTSPVQELPCSVSGFFSTTRPISCMLLSFFFFAITCVSSLCSAVSGIHVLRVRTCRFSSPSFAYIYQASPPLFHSWSTLGEQALHVSLSRPRI
jgi:hypothetical protein